MEQSTTPIADVTHYTNLMRNGFMDKLFFVDKLFSPWKSLVDYGCADGFLTKLVGKIFPDKMIIGYDEDVRMITRASVTGEVVENVSFSANDQIHYHPDVINLSSVLHEVYSYKSQEEVKEFWKEIFQPKRKYVIIRDMIYDSASYNSHCGHLHVRLQEAVREHAARTNTSGELKRFEEIHGDVYSPRSMVHWLTKYLYVNTPNWEREVKENYMSVDISSVYEQMPEGWEIAFREKYTLPYLGHRWREDFGMRIPAKTHVKMILHNHNI